MSALATPGFEDVKAAAARLAAKLAVGDPTKVTNAAYLLPPGEQPDHVDGLPLGTRGGMKFRHNFPADGEYRFTIVDLGIDLYSRVLETKHTVLLIVDGREVFRGDVGGTDLVVSPDGRFLYVILGSDQIPDGSRLYIVDRASGALLREVVLGGLARRIEMSGDGTAVITNEAGWVDFVR